MAFCTPPGPLLRAARRRATPQGRARAPRACEEDLPAAPTLAAVQRLAARRGYDLRDASTGPLLSLRLHGGASGAQLAYLTGAVLPNGRLHVESYKSLSRAAAVTGRRRRLDGGGERAEGARAGQRDARDGPDGGALLAVSPGMLVFVAALAAASERGARQVYGLAIDDNAAQHRRLVRYLRRFGGEVVMRVDDSLRSVPARVVYGGFGTVIRGDIADMLSRGAAMLRRGATLRAPGDLDPSVAVD